MIAMEEITFDDVLILPNYSDVKSRKDVDLSITIKNIKFPTPIMSANMRTVTGIAMVIELVKLGCIPVLHRYMPIDENVEIVRKLISRDYYDIDPHKFFVSIGCGPTEKERALSLIKAGARLFCIDIAHANSNNGVQMVGWLRQQDIDLLMVGNVIEVSAVKRLSDQGADIVKVGIGSGSVCTTRLKTGCGRAQVSAILDCVQFGTPIVSDGGIRYPGDICKALAAGSEFVMIGNMFAGTTEAPGPVINIDNRLYKSYRGEASFNTEDYKTNEGIAHNIPFKGSVKDVVLDLLGGLRSCLSYCGANNLDQFHKNTANRMRIVSNNTHIESNAHVTY